MCSWAIFPEFQTVEKTNHPLTTTPLMRPLLTMPSELTVQQLVLTEVHLSVELLEQKLMLLLSSLVLLLMMLLVLQLVLLLLLLEMLLLPVLQFEIPPPPPL